jgi:hypothetical protein
MLADDDLVVGARKLHLLPLSPPALVLERFFCSDTVRSRTLGNFPVRRAIGRNISLME